MVFKIFMMKEDNINSSDKIYEREGFKSSIFKIQVIEISWRLNNLVTGWRRNRYYIIQ